MLKRLTFFLIAVLCFLSAVSLVSCFDKDDDRSEDDTEKNYWYCYKTENIKYYICIDEDKDSLLVVDGVNSISYSFDIDIDKNEIEIEDDSKNEVIFSFEKKSGDYVIIDSIKFNSTGSAPKNYEKGSKSFTVYDFWKSITRSILPGIYSLSDSERVIELKADGTFYFIGSETMASGTYTTNEGIVTFTVNGKPSVDYIFSYSGDKLIINNDILTPSVINLGISDDITLGNITTQKDPIFDSIPSGFIIFEEPKTLYVNTTKLNVRGTPEVVEGNIIGALNYGDKVMAIAYNETWTLIKFNGTVAYLSSDYIVETKPADKTEATLPQETDVPDSYFVDCLENVYVCPIDDNGKPINALANYYSSPNRSNVAGVIDAGKELVRLAKTTKDSDGNGWSKLLYNDTVIYMRNSVISTSKPNF